MVDVALAHEAREPIVVERPEPVGLEGERSAIGLHRGRLLRPAIPIRPDPLVPAAERGGRADALLQCRRRDDAGRIHGEHGNRRAGSEAFRLPLRHEGRLILEHDGRGGSGKPVDQASLAVARAVDELRAGQAPRPTIALEVARGAQDERVQPVRCERVVLPDAVVDQHWQVERIAEQDGGVDHGIVDPAQRLLQPAQHVGAPRHDRRVVQASDPGSLPPRRERRCDFSYHAVGTRGGSRGSMHLPQPTRVAGGRSSGELETPHQHRRA